MDRIFNIDSGNGSIFTSKLLDRETLLWHNITVIAAEISKFSIKAIAVTNAVFQLRMTEKKSGSMLGLHAVNQGSKPEKSAAFFTVLSQGYRL